MIRRVPTPWGDVRPHDQVLGRDGKTWDVLAVAPDDYMPDAVVVTCRRPGDGVEMATSKSADGQPWAIVLEPDEMEAVANLRMVGLGAYVEGLAMDDTGHLWACPVGEVSFHLRDHVRTFHGLHPAAVAKVGEFALPLYHDTIHATPELRNLLGVTEWSRLHVHVDHPTFLGNPR